MASTLCMPSSSKRGLLASLWSLITLLTALSFLVALVFTLSATDDGTSSYNDDGNDDESQPEMAVTSRAMAFAALWTAVLATLMGIFGTVMLGWQSPTGQYYLCCSSQVHRTTPLALGSFIGGLLLFANLTLLCSVLFSEFQIRDYQMSQGEPEQDRKDTVVHRSSMAFSIMCLFLTVMYASFAALTYVWSKTVLMEMSADEHEEALASTRSKTSHFVGAYDGYIGERFDMRPSNVGFVAPKASDGTLT